MNCFHYDQNPYIIFSLTEQLNIALTMMDRAVAGNLPPGTSSYLTSKEPSGTPLAARISNNSPLAARISPPVGRNTPPPMPPPPRDVSRMSNSLYNTTYCHELCFVHLVLHDLYFYLMLWLMPLASQYLLWFFL